MDNEIPDLDQPVEFYDPHPGFGGAAIPIPSAVKQVADQLNGQIMTLEQAIGKIQEATDGYMRISKEYGFILLIVKQGQYTHGWRVIRFRKPEGG